jgi:hypothetical protein
VPASCRRLVVGSPHAPIETDTMSVANPRTVTFITEIGLKRNYVLASLRRRMRGDEDIYMPYVAPELAGVGDRHHRETSALVTPCHFWVSKLSNSVPVTIYARPNSVRSNSNSASAHVTVSHAAL